MSRLVENILREILLNQAYLMQALATNEATPMATVEFLNKRANDVRKLAERLK